MTPKAKTGHLPDKDKPDTYTLRLPPELRKRVERLAESQRVSLNQQIVRILELYFLDSGDIGDSFKGPSGRLFEVTGEKYEVPVSGERAILVELQVFEARSKRKVTAFNFGAIAQTLRDLHVQESDEEEAVQELARSVLRFYLRQGIEPETISWSQYSHHFDYTNTRILHANEIPNGVATLEDFLAAINKDDWFDYFLVGNYMQDLNRRICKATKLEEAIDLAEEVLTLTSKAQSSNGRAVTQLEKDLLSGIIAITARKRVVGQSQVLYLRAVANSSRDTIIETLTDEDHARLPDLKSTEASTLALSLAGINQRLLSLAPQPVTPALKSQRFRV